MTTEQLVIRATKPKVGDKFILNMSKQTKQESKPQTKREWALERCKASCQIGRGCYDGTYPPPQDHGPTEYAIYCLLRATEELAIALGEKE